MCCSSDNCGGSIATCSNPPGCTFADTQCDVGLVCPGGTVVSAACSNPEGTGNPCACTALQDLAGLSSSTRTASPLPTVSPWTDLSSNSYCQNGLLTVECEEVDGVTLPTLIRSSSATAGLEGTVLDTIRDLGPSLTSL